MSNLYVLTGAAVTFITLVPVLGWIWADVAGHTLEAGLTAAWAIAIDAVKALQAVKMNRISIRVNHIGCSASVESVLCCSPFLCRSRDAGILQYKVDSLGRRNLYNTLRPVQHAHKYIYWLIQLLNVYFSSTSFLQLSSLHSRAQTPEFNYHIINSPT